MRSMCRAGYCQCSDEGQFQEWLVWCVSARHQRLIDCQACIITTTACLNLDLRWLHQTLKIASHNPFAPPLVTITNIKWEYESWFWRRRCGTLQGGQTQHKKDSNQSFCGCIQSTCGSFICFPPPSLTKHNSLSKTTASPSGSQLEWKQPWHSWGLQKQTLNMNYTRARGT